MVYRQDPTRVLDLLVLYGFSHFAKNNHLYELTVPARQLLPPEQIYVIDESYDGKLAAACENFALSRDLLFVDEFATTDLLDDAKIIYFVGGKSFEKSIRKFRAEAFVRTSLSNSWSFMTPSNRFAESHGTKDYFLAKQLGFWN